MLVADDARIARRCDDRAAGRGARLILVSHLGRPGGKRVQELSMAPVAERLRELTGAEVILAPAVVGDEVAGLAEGLADGQLMLLENVRFEPGEERNDPELARALASPADVYVNDAFGAAHRAHASTEGVAHLLPAAAGRLLEREVGTLQRILEDPERPLWRCSAAPRWRTRSRSSSASRARRRDSDRWGDVLSVPAGAGHAVGESLCGADDGSMPAGA